jgi:hypothetical protein
VQPTGVTGCWVADFAAVQPTPKIWGATGDGATDDSVAVKTALTAMAGKTLYQGNNSYYLGPAGGAVLTIPTATTLKGSFSRAGMVAPSHSVRSTDPPRPDTQVIPYTSYPAFRLSSAVGINMGSAAAIDGVMIYRAGMVFPAPGESGFAGTVLNIAGDNVTIRNSLIMGFAQAIYSDGFSRGTIADMSFDNKNNIYIGHSTDTWQISHIHAWPFASDGPSMVAANWTRTGANFKIASSNDWTMVSHYLAWGYTKQFVFENASGVTCMDCDADNSGVSGSHGFEMTGTAADASVILISPKAYNNDVGIYRNDTGGTGAWLKITGADIAGSQVAGIYLDGTSGVTQLYNSQVSANISGITIATGASILDMDGNIMIGNGAPYPINALAATDNVIIGPMNRFGLNSTTGVKAAGPNVVTHAVSVSSGTVALPPVGTIFALTVGGTFGNLTGGWSGRQITLLFYATATAQSTAGGGTTDQMQLRGLTNYAAAVGATLTLLHTGNGTWIEVARQ